MGKSITFSVCASDRTSLTDDQWIHLAASNVNSPDIEIRTPLKDKSPMACYVKMRTIADLLDFVQVHGDVIITGGDFPAIEIYNGYRE